MTELKEMNATELAQVEGGTTVNGGGNIFGGDGILGGVGGTGLNLGNVFNSIFNLFAL
jgi:bacteriocin-like protein